MRQLLLVVFFLQLATQLIKTFSAIITELLWVIYNKFPTPTSKAVQNVSRLRREVLRLKRELNGVSAQDDFARWAKLRREHDKLSTELDQASSSISAHRSQFDSVISVLRFLGLQGVRFLVQFWFSNEPMFWLPRGWLPPYVEWLVALPKAPTGSVSIQLWWISCASVIAMGEEAIQALYVLAMGQQDDAQKGQPQAFAAKEKKPTKASVKKNAEQKKEL